MPRGGLKEEQLSKEGSRYFSYRDPEDFSFDFTKSRPWTENGRIERHVPCGVWKSPMYLNPSVYPNRNVLRFPTRPQTGKNVRWGEFKGKPQFVEKCVDSLEKTFDARDKFATRRPPQYTIKPQKVDKPGPCFHRALHKAVASGDKNHICRIVDPEGRIYRKKGGHWLCRKWTERSQPRDLVNHTIKEWEDMLKDEAVREARAEAKFQKLMRDVFSGMKGKSGVMKDMTGLLTREKHNHDDKQAAMFKQWEQHVFHNIQNQIAKKLEKFTPDQISKKLRYQQMRYAKAVDERRIFRDIVNEKYDPFELEHAGVHYNTKTLLDPMKHDLGKEKREKGFFGEPVFHQARTKETLDPFYWTYDQFRTTVHGHLNADDEDFTYKTREMNLKNGIPNPYLGMVHGVTNTGMKHSR
ncbi:uncharacterized protein [Physcomitrium patens]|uniref:uncharacterized protein n=1 Tax=Physcomitrium patens TaxID=3218 RepID=UPI000D172CAC|nr:uncharacterized protein LOC112282452 [Physcomitrium patens]|eukprot:XP_024375808.1 uncharacterized protein LOC112282452 [Physcomitrella patens]